MQTLQLCKGKKGQIHWQVNSRGTHLLTLPEDIECRRRPLVCWQQRKGNEDSNKQCALAALAELKGQIYKLLNIPQALSAEKCLWQWDTSILGDGYSPQQESSGMEKKTQGKDFMGLFSVIHKLMGLSKSFQIFKLEVKRSSTVI